jgi:hypothetical protein
VIDWMRAIPGEAHLPSLKLALSDTSYRVRASALRALAVQPGALKAEDVAAVAADPYPAVRAALAELAKAKSLG